MSAPRPLRAQVGPHMSAGLYRSAWPADHQNTARSKFVSGFGLPAGFDPSTVRVISNPELPYGQWAYTRGEDELYVYGVPPRLRARAYLARVDARTLEVRQKVELPHAIYIGGALMHASGDVFLVHGPRLKRFRGGDLSQEETVHLPRDNGIFSQYNGMLVAEDGKLILKGWALNVNDWQMVKRLALIPLVPAALVSLLLGALALGLGGGPLGMVGALLLPWLLILVALHRADTGLGEFFRPRRTGALLVIDPETMAIVHEEPPPERLAFARMAMTPAPGGGEWLVTDGDELVHRWRYRDGHLTADPTWSERYRAWGDGSYPGTGPSIWDGRVYYSDNTFPVGLVKGYRLYRKTLADSSPQLTRQLSPEGPDYMFFSTVIAPSAGAVLIWGTHGGWVSAHDLTDLSELWRARLLNTDCIAVRDDDHQVYASDHSRGLGLAAMLRSVSRAGLWPDIDKSFVVLDARTGQERLRVPLGKGSPVAGMIVAGYHGSVYCATRGAYCRVYCEG